MSTKKMIGAVGNVYLAFDNNLTDLAKKIENALNVPEFYLKSDQDPPYEIVAMTEALGFEVWLKKSNNHKGYQYKITIETMLNVNDHFNKKKFDLSPWLAQYIKTNLKIDTYYLEIK